jgi:O-antigen/teichoic acid export membrane protein
MTAKPGIESRFRQFGYNFLGNTSSALVLGAFTLLTARWLGPTDRGFLVIIISVALLSATICSMGHGVEGRRNLTSGISADFISISIILSLFSGLVSAIFISLLSLDMSSSLKLMAIAGTGVLGFSYASMSLFRDGLYGLSRFRTTSLIMTCMWSVQLVIFVVLKTLIPVSLAVTIFLMILISMLLSIFLFITLTRALRIIRDKRPFTNIDLRQSMPAIIPVFVIQYFLSGDRIVVGVLGGARETAFFSVAATFAVPVLILSASLAQIVQTNTGNEKIKFGLRRVLTILCILIILCGLLAAVAPVAIPFLLGQEYGDSVSAAQVYILGVPLYSVFVVIQASELGRGKYISISGVGIVGVLLSVFFSWLLIPPLGVLGAGWAFVIVSFFLASGSLCLEYYRFVKFQSS